MRLVIIGQATRIRYAAPTYDRNRARWPIRALWDVVTVTFTTGLATMRSGVIPDDAHIANRLAHQRMLDSQVFGLMAHSATARGAMRLTWTGL